MIPDKKVHNSWAMYDWANSVYNLVITTTFFPAYYAFVTSTENFPDGIEFMGYHFINTELKNYVLAFGFLLIALLSPLLSSIADSRGNKKKFMAFFCYLGAVSCMLLYFFDVNNVIFGLFWFMMAGIGFYGSQVFYNSYLVDIAEEKDRDRLSAKGYSYGYIGSVIMQMIGFALLMLMTDTQLALKLTFVIVGIWWIVFAQIPLRRLPKGNATVRVSVNWLTSGYTELKIVLRQLVHEPSLKRFLLAFFFYSMGVQTVMLVAIDFGIKILQLPDDRLIITAVIIQIVAVGGAILMSRLSERFGNVRVLILTNVLWMIVCVTGYFITTELEFYILAALVGLVMGGIQSLSRSTYSKLMPVTRDTTSFFSFYDVTEKIAIVIGLFSFGLIEGLTGSMRNSIIALMFFFAAGLVTLMSIRKRKNALVL